MTIRLVQTFDLPFFKNFNYCTGAHDSDSEQRQAQKQGEESMEWRSFCPRGRSMNLIYFHFNTPEVCKKLNLFDKVAVIWDLKNFSGES